MLVGFVTFLPLLFLCRVLEHCEQYTHDRTCRDWASKCNSTTLREAVQHPLGDNYHDWDRERSFPHNTQACVSLGQLQLRLIPLSLLQIGNLQIMNEKASAGDTRG